MSFITSFLQYLRCTLRNNPKVPGWLGPVYAGSSAIFHICFLLVACIFVSSVYLDWERVGVELESGKLGRHLGIREWSRRRGCQWVCIGRKRVWWGWPKTNYRFKDAVKEHIQVSARVVAGEQILISKHLETFNAFLLER